WRVARVPSKQPSPADLEPQGPLVVDRGRRSPPAGRLPRVGPRLDARPRLVPNALGLLPAEPPRLSRPCAAAAGALARPAALGAPATGLGAVDAPKRPSPLGTGRRRARLLAGP